MFVNRQRDVRGYAVTFSCLSLNPETYRRRREEERADGCFHPNWSLNSTAPERSNDLTLDGDGNVGINGIPRGGLQLQVVSPAQFETGGKSRTAGLEEIMR